MSLKKLTHFLVIVICLQKHYLFNHWNFTSIPLLTVTSIPYISASNALMKQACIVWARTIDCANYWKCALRYFYGLLYIKQTIISWVNLNDLWWYIGPVCCRMQDKPSTVWTWLHAQSLCLLSWACYICRTGAALPESIIQIWIIAICTHVIDIDW